MEFIFVNCDVKSTDLRNFFRYFLTLKFRDSEFGSQVKVDNRKILQRKAVEEGIKGETLKRREILNKIRFVSRVPYINLLSPTKESGTHTNNQ